MSKRIQLSRKKGWRLPEGAVNVARPGFWGNPFIISEKVRAGTRSGARYICVPSVEDAVECYRLIFSEGGPTADALRKRLPELRGKDLACWCALDAPCHADVLLELANTHPLSPTE